MSDIDKRVAELMGWSLRIVGGIAWWYSEKGSPMYVNSHFRPTTDTNHAMEVVDEMIKQGWGVTLTSCLVHSVDNAWQASFRKARLPWKIADGKTLTESICLAALVVRGE